MERADQKPIEPSELPAAPQEPGKEEPFPETSIVDEEPPISTSPSPSSSLGAGSSAVASAKEEASAKAAPSKKKRTYERIPAGFWLTAFALLFILLALGWSIDKHKPLDESHTFMTWQSPNAALMNTAGIFATFYRGTNFEKPYRVELIKEPFTFRTDHEWKELPGELVSARFSGWLRVPQPGKYKFWVDANDGARIWIRENKIFDDWNSAAIHHYAGEFQLNAGDVPIYAEWYNKEQNGWFGLWWEGPGIPRQFIPATVLSPAPGVPPPQ